MANSYNRVILMGNLTRDPQLSYTPNQIAVVEFGMAINRNWTSGDGAKHSDTCFVNCLGYGRLAENINKFFTKGKLIFIEGRLKFDSWTAQDGSKRSRLRVVVETFQFVSDGGSRKQETPASQDESDDDLPYPDSLL